MKTFSQFQNHAWFDSKPNLQKPEANSSKAVDKVIISEGSDPFNIAIVDPDDFDLVPNTPAADIGELKKLLDKFKYINTVPLAFQPSGKKFKIRTTDEGHREKIKKWIKDNAPNLDSYYTFGSGSVGKSGGAKIHENTQEIMVACLVLLGKNYTEVKHPDTNDLIRDAEGKYSSVIGTKTRMELLDQFAGNYNDLATAVSASNAILDTVGSVSKVFWTGKGWDTEIAPFNPPMGNIKDYNSSDIVVKGTDGIYYGFSLKKKSSSKAADPTLINKPITGTKSFLLDVISQTDLDSIEKAKEDFFDLVIKKYYKLTPAKIKKIADKDKGKMIRDISQTQMGTYLKSRDNKFFKKADSVIRKGGGTDFAVAFMEQIFRTNLTEIEDAGEFKFYLLTGIGKNGEEKLSIETAENKDLPSMVEAISSVVADGLTTVVTRGKKQAWDTGAGAAKIFHTIESNGTALVNIEIRYKGSYTANPQFQAAATPVFKALFK